MVDIYQATFAKVIIKHQGAWFSLEHGVYIFCKYNISCHI